MVSPLGLSPSLLLSSLLLLSASSVSAIPSLFPHAPIKAPHLAAAKRATAYTGWTAKGCVSEGTGGRLLTGYSKQGVVSLTVQGCLDVCDSMAYAYAGLEFGNECFCSDTLSNGGGAAASASSCAAPCTGDSTSLCGGTGFITLYQSTDDSCDAVVSSSSALPSSSVRASSSIAASSTKAVSSSAAASASISSGTVGTWTDMGCVLDNSKRLLTGSYETSTSRTVDNCQALCKSQGYIYAGLQWSRECYCSGVLNPTAVSSGAGAVMPASDCSDTCLGNRSQSCGGTYRLNLYKFSSGSTVASSSSIAASSSKVSSTAPVVAASPSSIKATSSAGISSTIASASSSAKPSVTSSSAAATWTNLGCVMDNSKRLLTGYYETSTSQTVERCQATCSSKGFIYAGLQWGRECLCSNELNPAAVSAGAGASLSSSECPDTCYGNRSESCGGTYRLNLYRLGAAPTSSAVATVKASSSSVQALASSSSKAASSSTPLAVASSKAASSTTLSATVTSSKASSDVATSSSIAVAGKWTNQGCVLDTHTRLLTGSYYMNTTMTQEMCQNKCKSEGYIYAGLQYYRECYCSSTLNTANGAGAQMPASDCPAYCLGNRTQTCGGTYRLTLFKYGA